MCGAVSFLLFIVEGRVDSLRGVIALFSNYTYTALQSFSSHCGKGMPPCGLGASQ